MVVNQIALRKGVIPLGNEPRARGEGRLRQVRARISQLVDAPNSLITVPYRVHEERRKRQGTKVVYNGVRTKRKA